MGRLASLIPHPHRRMKDRAARGSIPLVLGFLPSSTFEPFGPHTDHSCGWHALRHFHHPNSRLSVWEMYGFEPGSWFPGHPDGPSPQGATSPRRARVTSLPFQGCSPPSVRSLGCVCFPLTTRNPRLSKIRVYCAVAFSAHRF